MDLSFLFSLSAHVDFTQQVSKEKKVSLLLLIMINVPHTFLRDDDELS